MARPKVSKPAPKAAKPAKTVSRSRRSPFDLVNDLKAQRDKLAEAMSARISKLDQRIAELEAKHAAKIAITQLVESKTAEELEREEAELRAKLAVMKKARKLSATR